MPAGATFEPIATATVTSASNTVSFTGIPNTYTDLLILAHGFYNSGGGDLVLQFNSDTGNNYSRCRLLSVGSSINSETGTNLSYLNSTDTQYRTTFEIHVLSYTASVFKNVIITGMSSNTANNGGWVTGSWRNTAAITSVQVRAEFSPLWGVGSTFTLYGITGA